VTARLIGVLSVVSVLVAAWFGWSWWRSAHDDFAVRAHDRDAVLAAASDALVALNTIDYRDAGTAVDGWLQVTSGELGKTLAGDRQLQLDRATASRTEASASVDRAAVTELHGDTARVIAVLDVRLSTNGSPPATNRSRLNAELTRTPEGWKVDAVQAAA
jgi:Mce-associated membrane protein